MHLPGPLRAAVGLVATAAAEAKNLPDRAIELPMLVVSTALQASLRAQQRYARLAARGDEVLNRRAVTDEPPQWATFDEPLSVDELRRSMFAEQAREPDAVSLAESMVGELFGVADPHESDAEAADVAGPGTDFEAARRDEAARRTAAAKKTASARRAAGRTPRKATPRKAAPRKAAPRKTTARKPPATKATTGEATTNEAIAPADSIRADDTLSAAETIAAELPIAAEHPAADETGPSESMADTEVDAAGTKPVHKPRHTTPSAFDDVADD